VKVLDIITFIPEKVIENREDKHLEDDFYLTLTYYRITMGLVSLYRFVFALYIKEILFL